MDLKYLLVFFSISLVGASYFDSTVSSDFTNVAEALNVQFSSVSSGSPCPNSVLNAQLSTIQGLPTLNKIPSTMSIKNFLRYYCFYQDGSGNHPNINQYIQITDGDATCYWSCPCTNLSLKTANIVLPTEEVSVACPTTSSSTSSVTSSNAEPSKGESNSSGPDAGLIIGLTNTALLLVSGLIGTLVAVIKKGQEMSSFLEAKAVEKGNFALAAKLAVRKDLDLGVDHVRLPAIFRSEFYKGIDNKNSDTEMYTILKKFIDIVNGSGNKAMNISFSKLVAAIKESSSADDSVAIRNNIFADAQSALKNLDPKIKQKLIDLFKSKEFKDFLKKEDVDLVKYDNYINPVVERFITGQRVFNYDKFLSQLKSRMSVTEAYALKELKMKSNEIYKKFLDTIVKISKLENNITFEDNTQTLVMSPNQAIDIMLKNLTDLLQDESGKIVIKNPIQNAILFEFNGKGDLEFSGKGSIDYLKELKKNTSDNKGFIEKIKEKITFFGSNTSEKEPKNDLTGKRWLPDGKEEGFRFEPEYF